jgi:hypothetical protein
MGLLFFSISLNTIIFRTFNQTKLTMKKITISGRKFTRNIIALAMLLSIVGFGTSANAQHILVVNDNDNITYNTDTLLTDLDQTTYSGYHYWSIPDSGGATPSAVFMGTFDLVLWYCSTDGVGLKLWDATGTGGNPEVVSYVATGKPLWIIGQDFLYEKYATPATFTTGDFPKDVMGLESYDVQSYVDDGSVGCAEVNRVTGASTLFPVKLQWSLSTLWYVDGCTPSTGTISIYDMGPASYSLSGKKCMFHKNTGGVSVMSTLFEPALINTFTNRISFLENGIAYLLGPSTSVNELQHIGGIRLFPNPTNSAYTIEINSDAATDVVISLTNSTGQLISQSTTSLLAGRNAIPGNISEIGSGMYLLSVKDVEGHVRYRGKLTKL